MLWTDLITPAELTGYVRRSAEEYEKVKGTLARWLPNVEVADQVVRFFAGQSGLIPEARYRAFDAEPEMGKRPGGKRITLDLPALGQTIPVPELAQLRARNASDEQMRNEILKTAEQVTQAVCDRTERMRGTVLTTGKATILQDNYQDEADFGRAPELTVSAGTSWATAGADPLNDLETWSDLYAQMNGERPGSLVMSTRVFRLLAGNAAFATTLVGGATRRASAADVRALLDGAGLPEVVLYDRRTYAGAVLPNDTILLLPAPGETTSTTVRPLGATHWGQTLTSTDASYGIQPAEQPGIVAGVYRGQKPPLIAEVTSDAIALPVLSNANLSLAAKVVL